MFIIKFIINIFIYNNFKVTLVHGVINAFKSVYISVVTPI